MTAARSNSAEVRNPVAADPEVAAILAALTPEARQALRSCLMALSKRWRAQAEEAWRKHKPPMAAYWKANAVNARHLALALGKTQPSLVEMWNAMPLKDRAKAVREMSAGMSEGMRA